MSMQNLQLLLTTYETKAPARCRAGLGTGVASVTDANVVEEITSSHKAAGWVMCRSPLVSTSEHYQRVFFFAVGSSPVLTTVFAANCLIPLLHDNMLLQDTVSLLGGILCLAESAATVSITNGQEKVVSLATKSAKLGCNRISINGKYRLLPFSGSDMRPAAELC
ncbi:hypothetical protein N7534_007329 [Penicillium rubens]|nr:hypothetical protein N7534_007329 [Penicillium rubens]